MTAKIPLGVTQLHASPPTRSRRSPLYKIAGIPETYCIQITGSLPVRQKSLPTQSNTFPSQDRLVYWILWRGNGITLTNFCRLRTFQMTSGVLKITGNGAKPGSLLNEGTLNLTGIFCDLSNPNYPISSPANLQLINRAHLNARSTMLRKIRFRKLEPAVKQSATGRRKAYLM